MEKTVKIKGMVCRRCIETVNEIFESQGLIVNDLKLGEVTFREKDTLAWQAVNRRLQEEGFEVLTDKQSVLIQKVKELVDSELTGRESHTRKIAPLISENLHMDYDTVSNLFSYTEGIKLEQYVIHRRVEKVQELLKYSLYSLTDIAFELGYSSVHHLSNQFKKITGMSPSQYRQWQMAIEKQHTNDEQ